jgi:hypothetical protein
MGSLAHTYQPRVSAVLESLRGERKPVMPSDDRRLLNASRTRDHRLRAARLIDHHRNIYTKLWGSSLHVA